MSAAETLNDPSWSKNAEVAAVLLPKLRWWSYEDNWWRRPTRWSILQSRSKSCNRGGEVMRNWWFWTWKIPSSCRWTNNNVETMKFAGPGSRQAADLWQREVDRSQTPGKTLAELTMLKPCKNSTEHFDVDIVEAESLRKWCNGSCPSRPWWRPVSVSVMWNLEEVDITCWILLSHGQWTSAASSHTLDQSACRLEPVKVNGKQNCADVGRMSLGWQILIVLEHGRHQKQHLKLQEMRNLSRGHWFLMLLTCVDIYISSSPKNIQYTLHWGRCLWQPLQPQSFRFHFQVCCGLPDGAAADVPSLWG